MEQINVLIIEDQPIYRMGLRHLLSTTADINVVADTDNPVEGLRYAEDCAPRVILVTDHLAFSSDTSGHGLMSEFVRTLRRRVPSAQVIIMANQDKPEDIVAALRIGAAAYVSRNESGDSLMSAIRRVADGEFMINEQFFKKDVALQVIEQFQKLTTNEDIAPEVQEQVYVPLSPRELEILKHVANGRSNKEIARMLNISDQTVKNHITSILRKLAVNDRTHAVVQAIKHGWLNINSGQVEALGATA